MPKKAAASLTLVTPGKPARRTYANPQIATLKVIATHWNALSGSQKASWKALSGQNVQSGQSALPNPVGPYATFVQVASIQLGSGGSIPTYAPLQPIAPQPLPPVTLTAHYSYYGLTLTLTASAPYPYPVTLYAAKPLIPNPAGPGKATFKRIGFLPALTTAAIDITLPYLSRYHISSEGYQIALNLVGISPSGHQTHGLIATALVLALAAEDALPENAAPADLHIPAPQEINKAA